MTKVLPFLAPRGVYLAPWMVNGFRHYYSVDSKGQLGRLRAVPAGADPTIVTDALWAALDKDDPITHDGASFGVQISPFGPRLVARRALAG
jgi:hypothetical protein